MEMFYFSEDKDGKIKIVDPPKRDYISLEFHPLNCVCGSKNIEMSNLVMTVDPLIYSWWCNDCGQKYRVQARSIGMEPEYKELKVNE